MLWDLCDLLIPASAHSLHGSFSGFRPSSPAHQSERCMHLACASSLVQSSLLSCMYCTLAILFLE